MTPEDEQTAFRTLLVVFGVSVVLGFLFGK